MNVKRLLASVRRILPGPPIIKHSARPKNANGQLALLGELAQGTVIAQDHNVLSSLIPIAAPGIMQALAPQITSTFL
jgi:hypothetical protein